MRLRDVFIGKLVLIGVFKLREMNIRAEYPQYAEVIGFHFYENARPDIVVKTTSGSIYNMSIDDLMEVEE